MSGKRNERKNGNEQNKTGKRRERAERQTEKDGNERNKETREYQKNIVNSKKHRMMLVTNK